MVDSIIKMVSTVFLRYMSEIGNPGFGFYKYTFFSGYIRKITGFNLRVI